MLSWKKNPGSQCLNPIGTANILHDEGPDLPPRLQEPSNRPETGRGAIQLQKWWILNLGSCSSTERSCFSRCFCFTLVISQKKAKTPNPTTKKVVACSNMAIRSKRYFHILVCLAF